MGDLETISNRFNLDNITLEADQDFHRFEARVPDKRWKYTDKAGHAHLYDDRLEYLTDTKYPTLAIRTAAHWDEDDDEEWLESRYECSKCGERICPGTTFEMQAIAGLTTYRINGEIADEPEFQSVLAELEARKQAKRALEFGANVASSG